MGHFTDAVLLSYVRQLHELIYREGYAEPEDHRAYNAIIEELWKRGYKIDEQPNLLIFR